MARILIHSNAEWASCYDNQTELLTRRGWILFKDIINNDVAMTFNTETSEMEWQQILNTTVQYIDNKDLISIKSRSVDLLVTPNHKILGRKHKSNKWFLRDASELYGEDGLEFPSVSNNKVTYLSDSNRWGTQKYTGNVYCAHVPNKTLLVRRNGRAVFCGNSGYGTMTRNLVKQFKRLNHEVAVSAFYGLQGALINVGGTTYYPMGLEPWGNDIIEAHASHWKANCILTVIDLFVLRDFGRRLPGIWYPYFPLDGDPVSDNFLVQLQGAVKGLVYSKFAENEFKKVKNVPCPVKYVPIGVDTSIYNPIHPSFVESKKLAKRALGYPDDIFLGIMIAANQSVPDRKCFTEQIEAFKMFHDKYPNSKLYLHTEHSPRRQGVDLDRIVDLLGAKDFVLFPNEYQYHLGYEDSKMRTIFNAADVDMHCVPEDTMISTGDNIKSIQSIHIGDKVLTHNGKLSNVTKTFKRMYNGQLIKIVPFGYTEGIEFTPEHPVLAIKASVNKSKNKKAYCRSTEPEWIEAGKLTNGDIIVTPRYTPDTSGISRLTFRKHVGNCKSEDGFLVYNNEWKTNIPNSMSIDEDFATLAGYFISEGTANNHGLIFSLNSSEVNIADEITRIVKSKFNICTTRSFYDRHRLVVRCNGSVIGRFFRSQFGSNSHNKRIPKWLFNRPIPIQRKLLSALFNGDGSCSNSDGLSYSTVSKRLAYQIVSILGRIGYPSSLYNDGERGFSIHMYGRVLRKAKYLNKNNSYDSSKKTGSYCFTGSKYIYRPINKIETREYNGYVYNIAVEDSESYVAGLISVHNCSAGEGFGMSIVEAQANGTPVITSKNTALIELTGSGWQVNNHHKDYYALGLWHYRPEVKEIYEALLEAHDADKEKMGRQAVDFINDNRYDWNLIAEDYWKDILDEIDEKCRCSETAPLISIPTFKEEYPKVTIASMIKEMNSDTKKFLSNIANLDYNKDSLDYVFMVSRSAMDSFKKWQKVHCPKAKIMEDPKTPNAKTRIERLVVLRNELLKEVKNMESEYVLFADSDVVNWNSNILRVLISDHCDVVAPLVLLNNTKLWFYDCWSFKMAGRNFSPNPPYNSSINTFAGLGLMESVGSFFLARKVAIMNAEFGTTDKCSDSTYLCNKIISSGFKIALDVSQHVYHSDIPKDCGEGYWNGPILPQELQDQTKDLIESDTTGMSTVLLDKAYENYKTSVEVQKKGIRWAYNLADFYTFYMNNNPDIIDIMYKKVEMPHYVEIETSTKCPIKCSHCTPGDSIVLGLDTAEIKDITDGDQVFDKNGKVQSVIAPMSRLYEGDIVEIKSTGTLPLRLTPEHKVFVSKRKWVDIPRDNRRYEYEDPTFVEAGLIDNTYATVLPKLNQVTKWGAPYKATPDLMRFLGLYLAEGASSAGNPRKQNGKIIGRSGTVRLSFGHHEHDLVNDAQQLIKNVFGKESHVSNQTTTCVVSFESVEIASWLRAMFGHKAINKTLPDIIMGLDNVDLIRNLLDGFIDGDGSVKDDYIQLTTSSKILALQLQLLLSRLGVLGKIYKTDREGYVKLEGRIVYQHDLYNLFIRGLDFDKYNKVQLDNRMKLYGETEQYFYLPIKRVTRKPFKGIVYNIETKDNTYQIANLLVHNCELTHWNEHPTVMTFDQYKHILDELPKLKWAGLSVSGDSLVYAKVDGKFWFGSISELEGMKYNTLQVPSVGFYDSIPNKANTKANVEWMNASLIKHKLGSKKMYEITTIGGKSIKLTEDHSIFKRHRKQSSSRYCIPAKVSELSTDDSIATSAVIPVEKCGDIEFIQVCSAARRERNTSPQQLVFRKIISIKEIPPEEYVYDFSVKTNENFIANGILCHNSGIGHHWMAPDFLKMVEETKKRGIYIEQFDDFLFLNKERAEAYIDLGFERLIASVEAATPETFKKMRPHSNWDKVIENISTLSELKRIKKSYWPELGFHYIIDKANIDEAPIFLDLVFQLGVNPLFVQYTRLLHAFPEIEHLYTDIPDKIRSAIDERSRIYNIPIQWNADAAKVMPSSNTCTAWSMPFIFSTGHVIPCCAQNEANKREYQKQTSMGNIFEQSFKDIWYGEKFSNFRKTLREGGRPAACVGCPIRQFPKGV